MKNTPCKRSARRRKVPSGRFFRAVLFMASASLSLKEVPSLAAEKYPVSVGIGYGNWTPAMDGYNLRFLDEANPSVVRFADGTFTTVRIRQSLETLIYLGHFARFPIAELLHFDTVANLET